MNLNHKLTLLLIGVLTAAHSLIAAELVGKLPGDLIVTNTGQATYSIPIDVAPGTGAMAPKLSLEYDSGGGYGPLGLGWKLAGLSGISRISTVYALDGYIDGVDYDENDQLSLNGQRLIYIEGGSTFGSGSSNHLSDGAIYRKLVDDFSKVVAHGSANGPTHFTVWSKDGLKKTYGLSGNSSLIFSNRTDSARMTWMLDRVEDRSGNYMLFKYSFDSVTNEHLLDEIEYTGNANAGLLPYNRIEFEYEDHDTPRSGFNTGAEIFTKSRLARIRCHAGAEGVTATEAWRYELTYEESPITQKSRLTSIGKTYQIAGGEQSVPATTINYRDIVPTQVWSDANPAFIPPVRAVVDGDGREDDEISGYLDLQAKYGSGILVNNYGQMDPHDQLGLRWVDLNGDGLTDIIYGNDYYSSIFTPDLGERAAFINDGSGFVFSPEYTPPERITSGTKSARDYGVRIIDVNGDGLPDFVRSIWNDSTSSVDSVTYINTPDVSASNYWVEDSNYALKNAIVHGDNDGGLRFADLNGDGLLDYLKRRDTIDVAYINTGSGWVEGSNLGYDFKSPFIIVENDGYGRGVLLQDLNGDKLVDIVRAQGSTKESYLNTGSGWQQSFGYAVQSEITRSGTRKSDRGFRFVDLNADGLIDWIRSSGSTRQAALNTGVGWVDAPEFYPPVEFVSGTNGFNRGQRLFDVNGDGLQDIVDLKRNILQGYADKLVYINTGFGWLEANHYAPPFPHFSGGNSSYDYGSEFVDLNGDGILDQVANFYRFWTSTSCPPSGCNTTDHELDLTGAKLNNHSKPDLLLSVTDGFGAVTAVKYAPITDDVLYTRETTTSTNASFPSDTFPVIEFQGPYWVVHQMQRDDGHGGTYNTSYRYAGARLHQQGFGFLGFRSFVSHDERTGLAQVQILRQDFPLNGMVEATWKVGPNDELLALEENDMSFFATKEVSNDFYDATTMPSGFSLLRSYFPHIDLSAESKWEFGDYTIPTDFSYEPDDPAANWPTPRAVTSTANLIDVWGNNTLVTIDYGDGATKVTDSTFVNDPTTWSLGRLLRTEVTAKTVAPLPVTPAVTRVATFEYDLLSGLMTAEITEPDDPQFHLRKDYERDVYGNIVKTSLSSDDPDVPTRVTEETLNPDATGRYYGTVRNALGHEEARSYDERLGYLISQTGPNGRTTYWEHDAMGRMVRETLPDGNVAETAYAYDTTVTVSDPLSIYSHTSHYVEIATALEQPEARVYYDFLGREIREQAESYDGRVSASIMIYDDLGRVDCVSEPFYLTDGPAFWTTTTYDTLGRSDTVTAPNGVVTKSLYDGLTETMIKNFVQAGTAIDENQVTVRLADGRGNVIEVTNDSASKLFHTYDGFGNRVKTQQGAVGAHEVSITYDRRGNKIAMDDPDMGVWLYDYDALGQLISQTDAKLQTMLMEYDLLGRVTRKVYGYVDEFTFDMECRYYFDGTSANGAPQQFEEIGQLRLETTSDGTRRAYYYDDLGRPFLNLSEIEGRWFYAQTDYDTLSRPIRLTHYWRPAELADDNQDGQYDYHLAWYSHSQKTSYNSRSFVERVTDANGFTWWEDPEYNASGQLLSYWTADRATETIKTYHDDTHLPATVRVEGGVSTIAGQSFTFDDMGNLLNRADTVRGLSETASYDRLNRMLTSGIDGTSSNITMTYDAFGNITSRSDVGDYEYGEYGPHAVDGITGHATRAEIDYDANGAITSLGASNVIAWTAFNKPSSITVGESRSAFTYGTASERLTQTRESYNAVDEDWDLLSRKTYVGSLFEQEQVWNETGTKWEISLTRIYIITPAGMVGSWVDDESSIDPQKSIFHHDHIGSIFAVTDTMGTVTESLNFGVWGERRNAETWVGVPATDPDTTVTDHGFTGHEMLDALGLVHMNGRIYDPLLGRFLSADPFVQFEHDLQSYNRYSYVANNPLSFNDPSGHFISAIVAAVSAISSAIASVPVIAAYTSAIGAFTGLNASVILAATFGAFTGLVNGGGIEGFIQGAFFAGVSAGLAYGIGHNAAFIDFLQSSSLLGKNVAVSQMVAHGVTQGVVSQASGGDFGSGALGALVAKAGGGFFEGIAEAQSLIDQRVFQVVSSAVVGGTVAEISGGEFANGAATAAMVAAFGEFSRAKDNHDSEYAFGRKSDARGDFSDLDIDVSKVEAKVDEAYNWLKENRPDGMRGITRDRILLKDLDDGLAGYKPPFRDLIYLDTATTAVSPPGAVVNTLYHEAGHYQISDWVQIVDHFAGGDLHHQIKRAGDLASDDYYREKMNNIQQQRE